MLTFIFHGIMTILFGIVWIPVMIFLALVKFLRK